LLNGLMPQAALDNSCRACYKAGMAKKLAYERYLWFHNRLQGKKYPKIGDLAEKFEISRRQAAREIEFMRLFLGAPIEYSGERNGYFYTDDNFQFPGLWVSEEEIVSLVVSRRLAAALPNRDLKRKFDLFLRKISKDMDLDLLRLENKISLKNVRYYRVDPTVFQAVLLALVRERQLAITYASGYAGQVTRRTVDPRHLLVYMGNWHLIAWCHRRQGIRDFLLSRMKAAEMLPDPIADPARSEAIREKIEKRYGIFFDGPERRVVLRFSPSSAHLVRDQVWFPGQECEDLPDGRLVLKFPVADFREVIRDILPFAAEVEVLEPPELRRLIAETIARMAGMYRGE
jgi:predicted DNA-binding transcriptional regulator YafY